MPTLHFLLPDGSRRQVEAAAGRSAMDAAVRANVPGIDAECGGACSCATCHVYLGEPHAAALAPADADEEEMLGFVVAERRATSRLSCQLIVDAAFDGLELEVPAQQS